MQPNGCMSRRAFIRYYAFAPSENPNGSQKRGFRFAKCGSRSRAQFAVQLFGQRRRERGADQFLVVAGKGALAREDRRNPGYFSLAIVSRGIPPLASEPSRSSSKAFDRKLLLDRITVEVCAVGGAEQAATALRLSPMVTFTRGRRRGLAAARRTHRRGRRFHDATCYRTCCDWSCGVASVGHAQDDQ